MSAGGADTRPRGTLPGSPAARRYVWLALVAAVVAVAAAACWLEVRHTETDMRTALLHSAQLAVAGIEPADVGALAGDQTDLARPEYSALKDELAAVKKATPGCAFAYLMGQDQQGAYFFFVDSEATSSSGYSPPGQAYEDDPGSLPLVFDTGSGAVSQPHTDDWGTFVSVSVPVTGAGAAPVAATLGLDIDAEAWDRSLAARSALPVGLTAALAALLLAAVLVGRSRSATRQARAAEERVTGSAVAVGELFYRLGPDPRANIDEIVRTACELTASAAALYNRLDDDERSLVVWSGHALPPDMPRADAPDGHICYEATVRGQDQTVVIGDLQGSAFERSDTNVAQYGLRAYLGHPIQVGGRAVGALATVDVRPREYTPAEVATIRVLARAVSLEEERMAADARDEHTKRMLHAVSDIDRLVAREPDAESLLAQSCRLLVQARGFTCVFIARVEDGAPSGAVVGASATPDGGVTAEPFAPLEAYLRRGEMPHCGRACLDDGAVHVFTERGAACDDCPLESSFTCATMLTVRLAHAGRVFGWLTAAADPLLRSADDGDLLGLVAGDLGYALHNLEVAERERESVAELARAERRHRELLNAMPVGLVASDVESGRFVFANRSFCGMVQRDPDEVLRASPFELAPERAHAIIMQTFERAMRGDDTELKETPLLRGDGEEAFADMVSTTTVLDGRPCALAAFTDVTERRHAEDALRRSEQQYADLFDHAPIGVYRTTPSGEIFLANPALVGMLGYESFDDLRGRDLEKEGFEDGSREVFRRELEAAGAVTGRTACWRRRDRSVIFVRENARVVRDAGGAVLYHDGTVEDLTEQRRLEAELEAARLAQEEHRFTRLFRDNPTPMVLIGWPDRRFVEVNEAFLSSSGFTREEAVGADATKLGVFVDEAAQLELLGLVVRRVPVRAFETRLRAKDGTVTPSLMWGDWIPYEGQECILWVIVDISERKKAEEAMRAAREAADLANRAKSEFLANMSHELRTPLNAVLGLSEGLLDQVRGPLNERQQASLRTIEASGRHLLDLINDMLDLARIEAGRLDLSPECVRVGDVCEASLSMVRSRAAAKDVRLELELPDPAASLTADPRRLKQILVNLLSNAVKFTPEGGRVTLAATAEDGRGYRFTVTDTGVGISPEDAERLFQPFVQLDAGLDRRHEGTGLGLALVRRLAEAHGGGVDVESEPGQGSRFCVTLPLGDVPDPVAGAASGAGAQAIRRRTALVIEDSPEAFEQLAGYLKELGYAVTGHAGGGGAVDEVRRQTPGLVVLDLLLPGASGWDVLAQLKEDEELRDIPVLVASVVDEPARARAAGAAGHILKPVTRTALTSVLRDLGGVHENGDCGPQARLLLAEDNEANVEAVGSYLEDCGYEVLVARDGNEAVSMADRHRPALILMDVQMPGLDGLAATRLLRRRQEFASTPIVALTALAMPGDEARCLAAGATAYIAKPVVLKDLTATIRRLLDEAADGKTRSSAHE